MPRFEIKVKSRPNIEVPMFSAEQMQEIGQFAVQVIKDREASGLDVFDEPSKPLQPKYALRKEKKGLPPVRDMRWTGNTLGSMQVLESDDTHVKVGIKGSTPFRKALFNQNLDPWFGLSPSDDQRVFHESVEPIFHQNILDSQK